MVDFKEQQRLQQAHDLLHHFDIVSLSRIDRIKHYGLHFSKYAGRFARGDAEPKTRAQTIVDAFLVCLSAANALNQALSDQKPGDVVFDASFTDAAGRFADACEKIDHLEEFKHLALTANDDIAAWLIAAAFGCKIELEDALAERRRELALRIVYAEI